MANNTCTRIPDSDPRHSNHLPSMSNGITITKSHIIKILGESSGQQLNCSCKSHRARKHTSAQLTNVDQVADLRYSQLPMLDTYPSKPSLSKYILLLNVPQPLPLAFHSIYTTLYMKKISLMFLLNHSLT